MSNFREAIAQIKSTIDIVDYISRSGVKLDPSSASKWKGLCPFHGEKTPSFYVDSQFQNYKCFGCAAGGDIFSYIEASENLDFRESVEKLAQEAGIEIETTGIESSIDYKSLRECIKAAANFYVSNFRKLEKDHAAVKEVTDRGLSVKGMIYGYALEGRKTLYKYLSDLGYSDEIISGTGVCKAFENKPNELFDFWNGRLMFIITDAAGKPVGFSGRKLFESDKRGKYVNSMDGPLFDKSAVLFHHSEAKKPASSGKMIFVAEGQFDVAAIDTAGLKNVVASSGTAFTKRQALMCSRMVGESGKVVFAFDGDEAGIKAALRVFTTAPEIQSQAYVAIMPKGMDPCDYRLEKGDEALKDFLLTKQIPLVQFVLDSIAKSYDLSDASQSSKYVTEAARILKTISSSVLLSSYMKKVALQAFVDLDDVKNEVAKAESIHEGTAYAPKSLKQESDEVEANSESESEGDFEEERFSKTELEKQLMNKIDNSTIYELFARITVLAFHQRNFLKALKDSESLPADFREIAKEGYSIPPEGKIIPEAFESPVFVKYLIDKNYFPYIHLMDDNEKKSLFLHLRNEIVSTLQEIKSSRYAQRVISTLDSNGINDLEMLQSAIEKEPKFSSQSK